MYIRVFCYCYKKLKERRKRNTSQYQRGIDPFKIKCNLKANVCFLK